MEKNFSSEQGHGQDSIRTVSGQQNGVIVTPQGHHGDTTVTPLFSKIGTGSGQGQDKSIKGHGRDTILQEISLAPQQLKIYDWLLNNGLKGLFNKPLIANETGISYSTIRKVIRKFEKLRIVSLNYDDCTKQFSYEINPNFKISRTGLGHGLDSIRTGSEQGQDTPHIVSSSNKKTNLLINEKFDTPEFAIWKERKTPPERILKWAEEFSKPVEDILESMCHKIHQLQKVDFKDKLGNPIENLENYFYRSLKESHGYIGPDSDYVSFEEQQIQEQEKRAKKRKELAERKQKARLAEIEAIELEEFAKMMDDNNSELYKKCKASVNSFVVSRCKKSSQAWKDFEIAMFEAFKKNVS